MSSTTLRAGAARRIITPPVGAHLAGWGVRASGDSRSRYVHDELYAKALVLQGGDEAWALITTDLIGIDAVATERIRQGVAAQTGLKPEAIALCGTHTHSGPVVGAIGSAAQPEDLGVVGADGKLTGRYGLTPKAVVSTAYYGGELDLAWKEWLVTQVIEATVAAWDARREAEVAFGQAEVEGVGSSRRVRLSDGTWSDPRREYPAGTEVVSRTEFDPLVRVMLLREPGTQAPLAAVINYGSHPWVFSTSGLSAEIAGGAADLVAAGWRMAGAEPPEVLFTAGPQGDITTIWNLDIENLWQTRPGETAEASLERREGMFDSELKRLSGKLAGAALQAMAGVEGWDAAPEISVARREVALPLKAGYQRPEGVLLAEWQQAAPEGHHLTEIQLLRIGEGAFVTLPGEPFTSLGKRLRQGAGIKHLLITVIANDYGPVSYLAEPADYELGGYELVTTPAAAEAGPILIEAAAGLLRA